MSNQLGKAIALASKVFENKLDKGGQPYILHCIRLMLAVAPDDERMQIAILHDAVEDSKDDSDPITLAILYQMGFSERVVTVVGILTHDKENVSYDDYIKAIALNKDATEIKKEDLKDNSNITRLKSLTKKDLDRTEKYHRAYVYLSKIK